MKKICLLLATTVAAVALLALAGCDLGDSDPAEITETVTITFDSDGGSTVPPLVIPKGASMGSQYPTPTKDGFVFDGWYNGTSKYANTTKINSNVTLKAQWLATYTVTFDLNYEGATGAPAAITVDGGQSPGDKFPAPPKRDGYIFLNWKNGETEYTAATKINSDVTLKAQWQERTPGTSLVTFDAGGGSDAPSFIEVSTGKSMGDQYPTPTKAGYKFLGWFAEETEYTADTVISSDITLTAQWEASFTPGTPVQADAATVVHENPQLVATAGNFGEGATLNADGTVTLAGGGGISYQFPALANGYDTITIELTVTGVAEGKHAKAVVKQYESSDTYTGSSGNKYPWLDNTGETLAYDLSGFGASGGFSLQYNTDNTDNDLAETYTVKITKITFKKIDTSVQDYTVDLSGKTVKNETAFAKAYDGLVIPLDLPADFPIASYTKLDVKGIFYDADGKVITNAYGLGQIALLKDPDGGYDTGKPEEKANILFSQYNLNMTTANMAISLTEIPGGLVAQSSNDKAKFIEITEIKFHN